MTSNPTSEGQEQELSWEEAVSRYLEQNPDYFSRYPEVLAALTVPHDAAAGAVSLIERQVRVLREKHEGLARQLRELVTIARENDVLTDRLHHFALAMIDAATLEDVIGTARDMLRQQYKLDVVGVRLRSDKPQHLGSPDFADPGDRRLDGVLQQFHRRDQDSRGSARAAGSKPIAGIRQDKATLVYLFGDTGREIRSSALVLLAAKDVRGVLALGSTDSLRFDPQMGTLYLAKLGELLSAAMARHL